MPTESDDLQLFGGGGACPSCGDDVVGLQNADGTWTDGTELKCQACDWVGWVDVDDDGADMNWDEDQPCFDKEDE